MNKEYLLILPSVFIREPFTIGNITFQRFGSEDDRLTDDKNEELLIDTQQMLINNGFSGIFTYYCFTSEDNFQKILFNIRKVIALFRYIAFEKHSELSLESLTYYLLVPIKMEVSTPELKYSLDGLQDGSSQAHYWAPGFKEVTRERNYPHILNLDNEHFLIQKFNSGELEDNYIIAIERFNRTFKENYDSVEDILNLTTAFEHILELKGSDKADIFADKLFKEFRLKDLYLEDEKRDKDRDKEEKEEEESSKNALKIVASNFFKWCKEFYSVRGQIFHGNAFRRYKKGHYDYWEECLEWKHPDGKVRYINHTFIAKKVFQQLIEKRLKGKKIKKEIGLPEKDVGFLKQIEYELLRLEIEPLITPNEVYYRKLKELVDKNVSFGEPYYEFISKIRQPDGTEDELILLEILNHLLSSTQTRFPDSEKEFNELKQLVVEKKNTALIALRIFKLSDKIYKKESQQKVIGDEGFYNFYLSQLLEKVHYSLNRIAWQERGKS